MGFDTNQASYQRLRGIYAEKTNRVVLWVGAGLSRDAGIPTWPGLRHALEDEAQRKIVTLDEQEREQKLKLLQSTKNLTDLWLAFSKLKNLLGPSSFQAAIRGALNPGLRTAIPMGYQYAWKMRIGGILTLNLDGLATRSHAQMRGAEQLHIINGHEVGRQIHLLKSAAPFVANLHGTHENAESWVFTKEDLDHLLKDKAYQTFISAIFSSYTVLFVGISADDIAAGGFLKRLKAEGVDAGQHFWITHRQDGNTDKWSEQNGIQVVRYTAAGNDHSQLNEFFEDLLKFVSHDTAVLPVKPSHVRPAPLPLLDPDELAKLPPEQIRSALNAKAAEILADSSPEAIKRYEEFCDGYEQAIHNAWYISLKSPNNSLFGYTLIDRLGHGAFGHVYKARAADGRDVAIKVLRYEVRSSANMIGSFRRGVKSMKILSDNKVAGMVPYKEAYEFPAAAVMDLVDGPNLEEAVQAKQLTDWRDRLRIAIDMVRIIRQGHSLQQRVLHRDIRPPNIMLRGFYTTPDDWHVVVLDFDLSWHKDATERSIDVSAGRAVGYAAPEQLEVIPGVTTRSALVDSFGIGMTLFFLFTENHPKPGDFKKSTWVDDVKFQLISQPKTAWSSLPARLARLICRSTEVEQHKRIDVAQIGSELERLQEALTNQENVGSSELWADEILSRCYGPGGYLWDSDKLSGRAVHPNGLQVSISADEVHRRVDLRVDWASSGQEDRRNLSKYLDKAVTQSVKVLKGKGWSVEASKESSAAFIVAYMDLKKIVEAGIDDDLGIREVTENFRFQ